MNSERGSFWIDPLSWQLLPDVWSPGTALVRIGRKELRTKLSGNLRHRSNSFYCSWIGPPWLRLRGFGCSSAVLAASMYPAAVLSEKKPSLWSFSAADCTHATY